MSVIKRYVAGIAAAVIALLLAVIGVQGGRLERAKRQEAERARDLYRAANEAQMRRERRQILAQQQADQARAQAEAAMDDGRRDYFEQD